MDHEPAKQKLQDQFRVHVGVVSIARDRGPDHPLLWLQLPSSWTEHPSSDAKVDTYAQALALSVGNQIISLFPPPPRRTWWEVQRIDIQYGPEASSARLELAKVRGIEPYDNVVSTQVYWLTMPSLPEYPAMPKVNADAISEE